MNVMRQAHRDALVLMIKSGVLSGEEMKNLLMGVFERNSRDKPAFGFALFFPSFSPCMCMCVCLLFQERDIQIDREREREREREKSVCDDVT